MTDFVNALRAVQSNPDYVITKVRVVGMASPDGSRERNEELAGARAQALADFVVSRTGLDASKVEMVNGGENWAGLYAMIEASDEVPDKAALLSFRSEYGSDYDGLKNRIRYYNGGRAWSYLYDHFFPILRTGAGDMSNGRLLSTLSRSNWERLRATMKSLGLDEASEAALLSTLTADDIERLSEGEQSLARLSEQYGDRTLYREVRDRALDRMLEEPHAAGTDNWAVLRERIAASDLEDKNAILAIIDNVPATRGREQLLRSLRDGETYRRIEELYSDLLQSGELSASARPAAENWSLVRESAEQSDLADKSEVLTIIDREPDPAVREQLLRDLNGGTTYARLSAEALPELLFGDDTATEPLHRDNWSRVRAQVASSDLPNKSAVLEILDTASDAPTCEARLRALDGGRTYELLSALAVPDLLRPATTSEGGYSTLSAENWRLLRETVAASNMSDKEEVLRIIDTNPDPAVREQRLRELNDGRPYRYVREVFFPELLYGLSPAAKENWAVVEEVVAKSDIENKEEVLEILRTTPAGAEREAALRALDGGRTWDAISEEAFSELLLNADGADSGSTGMSFTFETSASFKARAEALRRAQEAQQAEEARQREEAARRAAEERRLAEERERAEAARAAAEAAKAAQKPFYLSLRTNMLYDVALVPNLGIEFNLGRRWSIGTNWMYAWWNSDAKSRYWRLFGGELNVRKYVGRRAQEKPLTGHHVGVYGQLLTYDFELGGKGYLGGKPGGSLLENATWGAGLEYGYALPIGKRLNLDFSIGIGYLSGECWEYDAQDSHYVWQSTRKKQWFGPTKAEISLVWLLGRGNCNVKK